MNKGNRIAPHEAFEIHELLTLKSISCTKAATMVALVKDETLKGILQHDFNTSQNHIRELRSLLLKSDFADFKAEDTQDMGGTIRH